MTRASTSVMFQDDPMLSSIWDNMPGRMRSALIKKVASIRKFDDDLTLAAIVRLYGFQSGRCAATGFELQPTGYLAPAILRLDADDGYVEQNVRLVCRMYYQVRTVLGVYGPQGHTQAMDFWWKALQFDGERRDAGLEPVTDPIEDGGLAGF